MCHLKFLLPLLFTNALCAAQQPLPTEINYEGKQKGVLEWNDAQGKHLLLLTETGEYSSSKFKHENDGLDAELFAYHFLYDAVTKKHKQVWRIYDYVSDCNLDIKAGFVPKAATHTDLNKNGIPEIWVVYQLQCTGDISPPEMKIIMYEGNKKHAMRGLCTGIEGNTVFEKGYYEFDSPFKAAAPVVKDFAKKLWQKHNKFIIK